VYTKVAQYSFESEGSNGPALLNLVQEKKIEHRLPLWVSNLSVPFPRLTLLGMTQFRAAKETIVSARAVSNSLLTLAMRGICLLTVKAVEPKFDLGIWRQHADMINSSSNPCSSTN
jgi:hypothetical protein